jgi:branched-chain amino acid transport system permease protein
MNRAVKAGLAGGAVTIFLGLVGLIERFADLTLVGEQITFSRLILVVAPFMVGYVVSRPRVELGEQRAATTNEALRWGAAAGAVGGALVGVAAVAVEAFGVERVRAIFIQVTQDLIDFVTLGLEPPILGAIGLTAISAVAGVLGGAMHVVPARIRKPIVSAVAVILALGFLQRVVPVAMAEIDLETDWLYTSAGLTWFGAAVVGGIAAVVSILKGWKGDVIRDAIRGTTTGSQIGVDAGVQASGTSVLRTVILAAFAAGLIALPLVVGSIVSERLGTVMVFILLGLGLNIVVGYAGLLDLGYVAFFAVGAYATGILTGGMLNSFEGITPPAIHFDLNFYLALPIVVALAAFVGIMIGAPVLRLRGDYLALVTLGLGEMVTVLVASPWLTPLVGGPAGMRDISDAAIGGISFREPKNFYYLALAFVILALFVSRRLYRSRIGRAWTAMREDEQTADAMGISTTSYKLLAFAMGGAIGAIGGALFAVKIGSITPASFQVFVSIQVLGIVILGGLGSLPGVVVGALVLVGLPGILREFEEYSLLAYGAAVVIVMLLRPQGLIPNVRRTRELQEEERAQDAWAQEREEAEAAVEGATT